MSAVDDHAAPAAGCLPCIVSVATSPHNTPGSEPVFEWPRLAFTQRAATGLNRQTIGASQGVDHQPV